MQLVELVALGLALGTDAFSVSLAVGMNRFDWRLILKLSLIVALFHVLMPLIGINLAQLLDYFFGHYYFETTIEQITKAIGAGLLMILGLIMIIDSSEETGYNNYGFELSIGAMIILAISVSIDALSVGFSLGMLNVKMIFSCMILGLIAGMMVVSGLFVGSKFGVFLAGKAKTIGGLILIGLGIQLLFT